MHCMKLLTNWYGLRDAGLNWFDCVKSSLLDRGFNQSAIDPCLFTRGQLLAVVYVDDVIVAGKHTKQIENLLHSLKHGTDIDSGQKLPNLKTFAFTEDGTIKTFLGINIDQINNGLYLAQPFLISRILKAVGLSTDEHTGRNTKDTPVVKLLLIKDPTDSPRQLLWNYRSIVGMLNFLSGSTRPDIAMAVHQVARFCSDPRRMHEKVIMRIARCLQCTAKFGLFYHIDLQR